VFNSGKGGGGDKDLLKNSSKINGNERANKFAQEKGYKDAHDLKKSWLKGQKDTTVSHYDIYINKNTGEVFVVSKNQRITILTDIIAK
jgi:hypothetical protein